MDTATNKPDFEITTIQKKKGTSNDAHSLKVNKDKKEELLEALVKEGLFKKWVSSTNSDDVRYYFKTIEFGKENSDLIPEKIKSYFTWNQNIETGKYYAPQMMFNSKSNTLIFKDSYGYDKGEDKNESLNRYLLLTFMRDIFEKVTLKNRLESTLEPKAEKTEVRKI